MKAIEVLELLHITRPTLCKYVKEGIIETSILPNGRYDYDKESIYKLFNKGVERKTYIYARVSTPKQKHDLENQVELLKQFCFANGYIINGVYSDISSGISFEKRKDFFNMLDEILTHRVEEL
jgi:predicted site-specific integrase-resolvase